MIYRACGSFLIRRSFTAVVLASSPIVQHSSEWSVTQSLSWHVDTSSSNTTQIYSSYQVVPLYARPHAPFRRTIYISSQVAMRRSN